jgi:predicted nucleic acid-binding Zn ribbon protein
VSDDEDVVSTGPSGEASPSGGASSTGHDDSGLELARLISRSLAGAARTQPAQRGGTGRRRKRRFTESSGAHPDDRDPQRLDTTVGRLVNDLGWETDLRVHGVFGRWGEIVGEAIAAHCTPDSFAEGRLVVRTDSTAWATQLTLLAANVVRRLNEELGDATVTFLDVQGPSQKSWKKGRLSVPGRGPRDTYG